MLIKCPQTVFMSEFKLQLICCFLMFDSGADVSKHHRFCFFCENNQNVFFIFCFSCFEDVQLSKGSDVMRCSCFHISDPPQQRPDKRHDRGEMSSAGGLLRGGGSRPCGALDVPGRGRQGVGQLFFSVLVISVRPSGGVGDGPGGDCPGPWRGGARGLHVHREDAGWPLSRTERWPHQQPPSVSVLPPGTRQAAHRGPRVRPTFKKPSNDQSEATRLCQSFIFCSKVNSLPADFDDQ